MGMYVNPGNNKFREVVDQDYIDKTLLIDSINKKINTMGKLICSSRPRRFGKSYSAKMLCAYYDRSCDSHDLFGKFRISKRKSYREHLNRYNVIYIDVTAIISNIRSSKKRNISDICDMMTEAIISELCEIFATCRPNDDISKNLILAAKESDCKFVIIIDEWDAIFREYSGEKDVQESYINLLRLLFKNGNATDVTIAAAYMTGILPIKKYGHQSAISDFTEYTMLNPGVLEEYIGFTQKEVDYICKRNHIDADEMKSWYDGYKLSEEISVYSPVSVMQAKERRVFDSYWSGTETYESLLKYIDMNYDGLQDAILDMMGGIAVPIDPVSFQNDITSFSSRDDILTLLVHLGYLNYSRALGSVTIPNKEIEIEMAGAVKSSKRKELTSRIQLMDKILEATLKGNEDEVAEGIHIMHDYCADPRNYNNEQALKATVRMAYFTCIDDYIKIEELPGGHGYADMTFLPKRESGKPAILIELKYNKSAEAAIKQILDKRYPEGFTGYRGDMLLVGINYDATTKEHKCKIMRIRL